MNHISDGLWVSDIDAVSENPTDRFDLIVSVCQDTRDENVGCAYAHYSLADGADAAERWGGSTDYATFAAAAHRVLAALRDDRVEHVLVHCHAGQNRSVAICTAVIAVYADMSWYDAYDVVVNARPIANMTRLMRKHSQRFSLDR